MAELTPNPSGCKGFVSNAFKKEKCKHCGLPWTQHQGLISDDIMEQFMKAQRKVVEDKQKAEDLVQAKAAAKKAAKKKQNQAVEDDWLFDGSKSLETDRKVSMGGDTDSDDDMGFKMFVPSETTQEKKPELEKKPFKVMNLIDFDECDVAEQELAPAAPSQLAVVQPMQPSTSSASASMSQAGGTPVEAGVSVAVPSGVPLAQLAELQEEIEHLRQMLRDANEEKSIQVAIVQDEVEEKRQRIEEMNTELRELRLTAAQSPAAQSPAPPPPTDEAPREGTPETEVLRSTVAKLEGEIVQLRTEAEVSATIRNEVAQLQLELERLRQETATHASRDAELTTAKQEAEQAAEDAKAQLAAVRADLVRAEEEKAEEAERFRQQIAFLDDCVKTLHLKQEAAESAKVPALVSSDGNVPALVSSDRDAELAAAKKEIEEAWAAERLARAAETELRSELKATKADVELARIAQEQCAPTVSMGQMNPVESLITEHAAKLEVARWKSAAANGAPENSREVQLMPAAQQPKAEENAQAKPQLWAAQLSASVPIDPTDADAIAQQMGRHAAQALREIRLNAEQQLAWLSKRMIQVELPAQPVR